MAPSHPRGDEREGDGDADARPDARDVPAVEIRGDMREISGGYWEIYGEIWGRYRGDGGARPDAGDVPAVGGGWVNVLE